MRSAAVVPVVFATSDIERSTSSPGPPWRTTRVAASAATAAYSPLTHSIVRPPACTGSRLGCPRTASGTALGLQDDLGERAVGVRAVPGRRA